MYDAVIAARDAGVNLGFFGANAIYWQARFEPSSSGVPNRVLVCYRFASLDPITDLSLKTVLWRDPVLNRPEQTLIGVQFTNQVPKTIEGVTYVVTNSGHWVYAGTGFRDGDSVPGLVGYETDRLFNQYPLPNAVSGTYTLLSNSPFIDTPDHSNSSVYQAPTGPSTPLGAYTLTITGVSGRLAHTATVMLVVNPPPDFTLSALPSSGTVAPGGSTSYSVTISPTGGFTGPVTLSVSGLPSGANGSFTPNPATGSSTLSVTTGPSTPLGTSTLTVTGVSGSLTHTTTVALTVRPAPDFTLSASPSSRTVAPGGSTSYSVTISPTGGFSGPVTLSVSG